jgi:DNA-binding FadR family transcriptional regulator
VAEQVSPRGTFLQVADRLKSQIKEDPEMTRLPTAADLMRDHGVSRGVALRAFRVLREEGVAEPVRGGRWRVVRGADAGDKRPLHERIADIITIEKLAPGAKFPSASDLAGRFGGGRRAGRWRSRQGADGPRGADARGAFVACRS